MKEYEQILLSSSLFIDFKKEELSHVLTCLQAKIKNIKADEYVFFTGEQIHSFGILLSGTLEIVKENLSGNRYMVATVEQGELFGEGIVCTRNKISPVTVKAQTDSQILLIPYQRIITTCEHSCTHHVELIHRMMLILGEKNTMLNHKIELLVLNGIRKKLATFLLYEVSKNQSHRFTINMSRNALAEYLNVSRPSMSRELAQMKKEEILDYHMNSFYIRSIDGLKDALTNE